MVVVLLFLLPVLFLGRADLQRPLNLIAETSQTVLTLGDCILGQFERMVRVFKAA